MTLAPERTLAASDATLPLHVRIREELRDHILRHRWLPHSRIPSEAELMRHYAVSRITVRQALHALAEAGLIVKVAGRGSFVAGPRPYQQLTRLQGLAESLSPQGYRLRNRILELNRVPAPPDVAKRLQLPTGTTVTFVRRVRLIDDVPVSADRSWLPQDLGDRIAMADLEHRDIYAVLEREGGTPLGYAEMSLNAVAAPQPIAEKLGIAAGAAVMYGERVTHDRRGRPVDFERIYWRGDNFQFQLHIDREGGSAARAAPAAQDASPTVAGDDATTSLYA